MIKTRTIVGATMMTLLPAASLSAQSSNNDFGDGSSSNHFGWYVAGAGALSGVALFSRLAQSNSHVASTPAAVLRPTFTPNSANVPEGSLSTLTPDVAPAAPSTVPEPGTLALVGTGLLTLAGAVRRKHAIR